MRIFNPISAALLALLVLAGCDGNARPFEEAVEVRTQNLTSIDVVPPKMSVDDLIMNIGESVQFGVRGTSVIGQQVALSGSDRQWQVTDESVAGIDGDGQLVARANGNVGVFISIGGLVSAAYDLRVSDALLTGVQKIVGEPIVERCLPRDYQATGLYDDGSERDLAAVNWSLSEADANNARLQNNPDSTVSVTGLNAGAVTLRAARDGFSLPLPIEVSDSLTALSISPSSARISVDDTAIFAAFGAFTGTAPGSATSDTSATTTSRPSVNVSASVDWQIISGTDKASVSNRTETRGQVTGKSSGSATLTASCGSVASPAVVVTVNDSTDNNSGVLSFQRGNSIVLAPGSSAIVLSVSSGSTYSSANLLDNDDLTWQFTPDGSTTPAIDLVLDGVNAGQVRPLVANGSGTITVTDSAGATGSIKVEVSGN